MTRKMAPHKLRTFLQSIPLVQKNYFFFLPYHIEVGYFRKNSLPSRNVGHLKILPKRQPQLPKKEEVMKER